MPDEQTEYKTIRVPADVYENAKARKEAWDVTWGDYVSPHKWHSVFQDPDELTDLDEGELVKTESDTDVATKEDIEAVMSALDTLLGEPVAEIQIDGEDIAHTVAERFDYAAIEAAAKKGAREGVEEMAR